MTAKAKEIQRAVRTVLDRGVWPEYRVADDRGLDEQEYAEFVAEVVAEIEAQRR